MALDSRHIQQRDGRWVFVDLVGTVENTPEGQVVFGVGSVITWYPAFFSSRTIFARRARWLLALILGGLLNYYYREAA